MTYARRVDANQAEIGALTRRVRRKTEANCARCSKQFWKVKRKTKYCSYSCAAFVREAERPDKAHIRHVLCTLCAVGFVTKKPDKKFCSRRCYWKFLAGQEAAFDDGRRMPRHWNRKDKNHAAVVEALEKIGCSVIDTSALGGGVPDLIIGYRGRWYVMEIKNTENHYGRRGLNKNQRSWVEKQRAPVFLATSPLEAVALLQEIEP